MAKLVVVTRTFADINRGDVSSVYNDDEDEGREVRETDLFRVVKVPGDKALYADLARYEPRTDVDREYDFRSSKVDLDAIEAAEVVKVGKELAASDEVAVSRKADLDALVTVKAIKRRGVILPPDEKEPG